jgi:hypothetical protein
MQTKTNQQYDTAIRSCEEIFIKKTKDYGTSWRVYRTISVVDQIYIKAKRIRNIQGKKLQRIDDDLLSEFKGIINYGVIGLIQLDLQNDETEDMDVDIVTKMYDEKIVTAKQLMEDKNHDYGEAWRDMSQESNEGKTLISEGIDANYYDIINYAVFALILAEENKN